MKHRKTVLATVTALSGTGICLAAMAHFLRTILNNNLPWTAENPTRQLYVAVGHSYTEGFIVGFFLSFSLVVAAIAISTWFADRDRFSS